VAVIVADPAPTALTIPLVETVAAAGALLAQVTTRPDSTAPAESFIVALSWTDPPTRRLEDGGVTLTDATGTTDTVTLEVPLWPSLVAVMVADPLARALTRPSDETDATLGALLDQVIVRPLNTFPEPSSVVAMNSEDVPTRRVAVGGETTTLATGTMTTLTAAGALCPSLVAVIVAAPAATPDTSPVAETDATAGASLDQVTTRPVRMLPNGSRVVAVSCDTPPTGTSAESGLTETDATRGCPIVTDAVSNTPEGRLAITRKLPTAEPAR